jgi:hypothetical protein
MLIFINDTNYVLGKDGRVYGLERDWGDAHLVDVTDTSGFRWDVAEHRRKQFKSGAILVDPAQSLYEELVEIGVVR